MNAFQVLFYAMIGSIGLYILGSFTSIARKYHETRNNKKTKTKRETKAGSTAANPPAAVSSTTVEEGSFTYWLKELATPRGILGLLFTVIEIPILLINSYIIAIRLETIFGASDNVLFVLNAFNLHREITFLDVTGLLISVGQMVSAEVFFRGMMDTKKHVLASWTKWLGAIVLIVLVSFEISVSAYGGWLIGGGMSMFMSMCVAAGICGIEVINGIFILHYFLIPVLLLVPTAIIGIAGVLRKAFVGVAHGLKASSAGFLTGLLMVIDKALMDPLRGIDAGIASACKRVFGKVSSRQQTGQATEIYHLESVPLKKTS